MDQTVKLSHNERIAGMILALAIIFVICINLGWENSLTSHSEDSSSEPVPVYATNVSVTVSGAVEKPGTYQVKKGTLLKDFLNEVGLKQEANLKRYNLDKPITRKRNINIPAYQAKIAEQSESESKSDSGSESKSDSETKLKSRSKSKSKSKSKSLSTPEADISKPLAQPTKKTRKARSLSTQIRP